MICVKKLTYDCRTITPHRWSMLTPSFSASSLSKSSVCGFMLSYRLHLHGAGRFASYDNEESTMEMANISTRIATKANTNVPTFFI